MIRRDFLKSILAASGALSVLPFDVMLAAINEDAPRWVEAGDNVLVCAYKIPLEAVDSAQVTIPAPDREIAIGRMTACVNDANTNWPVQWALRREGNAQRFLGTTFSSHAFFVWSSPGPLMDMVVFGDKRLTIEARRPTDSTGFTVAGVLVARTATSKREGT